MSWAKDPKDLYDVRVHRFGSKVAEEKEMEEKERILKSQEWKKITPEEKKYIVSSDKQQTAADGKIKYSADELTVAAVLYGKNSEIYKAMLKGEKISLLIRKSVEEKIKKGQEKDPIECKLFNRCLEKEKALATQQ